MSENYQRIMDSIISELDGRKKLLLHACCAPCATYCAEYLMPHFDITLYYYNPNTHPREEYLKRADALKKLAEIYALPVLEGEYEDEYFFRCIKGLENATEGGERCAKCFEIRLDGAAKAAKENGFDAFATTLTVSPHKNAELINRYGFSASEKYAVPYLPSDFKKKNGFKRSVELSSDMGLYRQNYCGCIYSLR